MDFDSLRDFHIYNDNSTMRELQLQKELERRMIEAEMDKKKAPTDWKMFGMVIFIGAIAVLVIFAGLNQFANVNDANTKLNICTADNAACQQTLKLMGVNIENMSTVHILGTGTPDGVLHG